MRLLIITQVVDKHHPVLGFFCGWIEEFSKQYEHVTVIGQQCGSYSFNKNVQIVSLGKENNLSKIQQVLRFYKYIWRHRKDYDVVFVHMIPLWVILGSPLWKLLQKPIYLWYEARSKTIALRMSLWCVRKHFSASESGMLLQSKKHIIVGHGINTDVFTYKADAERKPILLSVGRITAAKKPLEILECFKHIESNHTLHFAGTTISTADKDLKNRLQNTIEKYELRDRVRIAACNYQDIVPMYQQADILIHMSTTPLDKALLEAMACGCIVVGTSVGVQTIAPQQYCKTSEECNVKLQQYINMSEEQKKEIRETMRTTVIKNHTLHTCIQKLHAYMEES